MKAPTTLAEARLASEKTGLPINQVLIAYGINDERAELYLSNDIDELWEKLKIIPIGCEEEDIIFLKIEKICLNLLLLADTLKKLMDLYKKAPKKEDNSPRGIYVRLEILKKIVELTPDDSENKIKVVSVPTPLKYIEAGEKLMAEILKERDKKRRRDRRKKRSLWQTIMILIKARRNR